MTVAATPNAATTCSGGTVTAAPGADTIGFSGGSVGAGFTCTVTADVTSSTPGAHVNTSGALTSSLGSSGTAMATLTVPRKTFTEPAATGGGSISGIITGGGDPCTIASVAAVTPSDVAGDNLPGVTFPHGLIDLRLENCTAGSTVTFVYTFPEALPEGTELWKYGPRSVIPSPHWYGLPATVSGNTITFSITDGGEGDDDLTANGVIEDPSGPGVGVSVPAMPPWALVLLALVLVAAGGLMLRWYVD